MILKIYAWDYQNSITFTLDRKILAIFFLHVIIKKLLKSQSKMNWNNFDPENPLNGFRLLIFEP